MRTTQASNQGQSGVSPIFFLKLLLDALEVFDQQILARELVVVAEVVDALMILQPQSVEMIRHPLLVRPNEIEVLQATSGGGKIETGPMAITHHVAVSLHPIWAIL